MRLEFLALITLYIINPQYQIYQVAFENNFFYFKMKLKTNYLLNNFIIIFTYLQLLYVSIFFI